MCNRVGVFTLAALALVVTVSAARADTLTHITKPGDQGANDSVKWSQLGTDATTLGTSFPATSVLGDSVTGNFAGATPTSIVSAVCAALPCSWADGTAGPTPFAPGDSLIWTSDGGNSGNGPLTLTLTGKVSGAGALIQEDAPGQFTAVIQVFNGASSLGSFSESSDAAGDPIYIGVKDTSGANISKIVFSISSTANSAGDLSDFAVDTLLLNGSGGGPPPPPPGVLKIKPAGKFGKVKVGRQKSITFTLTNTSTNGASITFSGFTATDSAEFTIVGGTCSAGTRLPAKTPCTLIVQFKPAGKGPRPKGGPTATLTVHDNASNEPQVVKLTGKGI